MQNPPLFDALLIEIGRSWIGLSDKPEETPESTLRTLWLLAAGQPLAVTHCWDVDLPPLSEIEYERLRELLYQRQRGVPLAHLTQRQYFLGLEMLVGPDAMIPRKETEILGRAALEVLQELVTPYKTVSVLDLCTGCGNIALALAHYVLGCRVYACDLSSEALVVAEDNAQHLGLVTRVSFSQGDLFAPYAGSDLQGNIDLVTCNPPYISEKQTHALPQEIRDFEPALAFNGGPFGISILMRLLKEAPTYIRSGGKLCFEVGLGQGDVFARKLQRDPKYRDVRTYVDAKQHIRAICAEVT